jgi:hypothetical protein
MLLANNCPVPPGFDQRFSRWHTGLTLGSAESDLTRARGRRLHLPTPCLQGRHFTEIFQPWTTLHAANSAFRRIFLERRWRRL